VTPTIILGAHLRSACWDLHALDAAAALGTVAPLDELAVHGPGF